jgi:ankyrin repeat protein
MSSSAPLPVEIHRSAQRGELQAVVKWLRNGGHSVDALGTCPTRGGQATTETLLHAASGGGHLEMVKELLKHGASVNLQSSLGLIALMAAACAGHLSIVLVLLQHLADPDLQDIHGQTALMWAVGLGQEVCVRALLRAKANTELLDEDGRTPLLLAEAQGYTAIANLIRQHTAPPQPAAASPAAPPDAGEPISLPVEIFHSAKRGELQNSFGATALMAAAGAGQGACVQALLQAKANTELLDNNGDTALKHAQRQGHTAVAGLIRRHLAAAASSSGGPVAPQATQAEKAMQAVRANTAMRELLADEAEEQAKRQASPKTSKKKKKAGRAAAAGDEQSVVPSTDAPALPPAATPKLAEVGLRAAISGGGLSALEAALAAAPRKVREGSVGAEAKAWCSSRLLEAQQEAEREAKQQAAREAAKQVWLWVRNFADTFASPSQVV